MEIEIRPARPDDLPELAVLNKQLIDDEGSRNPMNVEQLQRRMMRWLSGDWSIVVVLADSQIAGYCVYRISSDEYYPEQSTVYVRQFCVRRDWRGRGVGRTAFEKIVAERFPADAPISLEVLETNLQGRRFWGQLGFRPYSTTMIRGSRAS